MKYKSESELVNACLSLLAARGIFHWRQNQGRRGKIKFTSINGIPDIVALLPRGVTLWIECKMPKEEQSHDQIVFEKHCRILGHRYHIIRDVDELNSIITMARS